MSQRKVYTENTKKDIKIGKLICLFLLIFGLFYISKDMIAGGLIILLSFVGLTYYNIKTWWNHG